MNKAVDWQQEVQAGSRFEFGSNWRHYLNHLTDSKIANAKRDLQEKLGRDDLNGLTFLDIGSGSGLHSLAARMLGASVVSFDYDPQSVACAEYLKQKYFPNDAQWKVQQGSALDQEFIHKLGQFDIVYSWGVLHHTGQMWQALELAAIPVKANGKLFISIYNDQGGTSRRWRMVKRWYNALPKGLKWLVLIPSAIRLWAKNCLIDLLRKGNPLYSWKHYQQTRGMSPWIDIKDWVGGYPFEVAKPEEIFYFYQKKGFTLRELTTCGGGIGCNIFVFQKQ